MKILYVGTERAEAQAVATALNSPGKAISVSWTSGLDRVANWIDENDGLRVLVVEARSEVPVWRSVLTYAAGLATALPVVVIVPEPSPSDPRPLALEGCECIARNPSLLRDLPAVITRAIDRARRHQLEHAMRDMVNEQFREAVIEVERVRQRHASAVADAERLARREAELSAQVDSAASALGVLERRLADAENALHAGASLAAETERCHTSAITAAAVQCRELQAALSAARQELESKAAQRDALAAREAELDKQLRQEGAARAALEEGIADAGAALAKARRENQSISADVTRLIEREAALTYELTNAHAALREEQQRHADALKTADAELAERQTQFLRERAQLEAERAGIIAQLREVEVARDDARREHQSAVADLARLTEREGELERRLEEERATCGTLEQTVAGTAAALRDEQQRHADALKAAASERAEHLTQFERERAQVETERSGLKAQLRQLEEARDEIKREHQSTLADMAWLTEREAALTAELTGIHAALRDEQQRHADALKTAAVELAEHQAHFQRERDRAEADRAGLTAQLREVEEARDESRREHQSAVADIARLTERESALTAELTGIHAALRDEQQRHADALKAAAVELAEHQAHFERERAQAETKHYGLTTLLREVEGALDEVRREHQSAVADIARLTEREAALTSELTDAHAALRDQQQRHADALKTAAGELAEHQAHFQRDRDQAEADRAGLTALLREVEEARDEARREHQSAVADIARLTEREAALEGRLREERATRDTLEQTVAGTAAALRDEQQRHADALKTAAAELAEHQAHFQRERDQAEADRAGLTAQLREVEESRDEARREHQSALADIARLTENAAASREAAAACQSDLEARMLVLQKSLHATEEESHRLDREHQGERSALQDSLERLTREHAAVLADNHRLFQQAPLPMFRCTKDGVLTEANRILTVLVGHHSAEELRGADLAAATFESPNDLAWLIERCLGSRGKETTETTWHRKDGSRLWVRLSACATSSGLIECGVEDLTPIRVLQDRLSQAHRMEAVGRLANEVAVTCGSLLGDVHQNAQQWLMTDAGHPGSRRHGEMLLEEISRATGLLRQLAAYGDEESRRPAVVELRTVVRDVAPVLKRVAGDAVDVQLPAARAPLNVDAGAERVKRLLVNLAAYGRERMPFGGQLKIELGTAVVDRHFAAKHPNVRLGPHALVTVTESRRASRTAGLLQLHDNEAGSSSRSVAVQAGVDLGTLQELVAECGGHLWMTVEPVGNMIVKIRLPLVTSYGEPPQRTLVPGGRVRTLGQWFQH